MGILESNRRRVDGFVNNGKIIGGFCWKRYRIEWVRIEERVYD